MMPLLAFLLGMTIAPRAGDAPNRQPQLAVRGEQVALVYGAGSKMMFAQSADEGRTFSAPSLVADLPGLNLGRHRGPRVVYTKGALLVTAIDGAAGGKGNLMLWRSTDHGRSWSKPALLNDVAGAAREGLGALAADADGHVAAVWLDLRTPGTKIYGTYSGDSGETWSTNELLYASPGGTVCQCCDPSLLARGGGVFAVMFRNVIDGNRDLYLAEWDGHKPVQEAQKLGEGSWHLNACPMDGGGLAEDRGKILSAWRRGEDVYLAEPGGRERRLGAGKDVALAAGKGNVAVLWTEAAGVMSWVDGKTEVLSPQGAFPVVAALPDGRLLAAWEDGGTIVTRLLQPGRKQ